MAHVSNLGSHTLDGQGPPLPRNTSGGYEAKAVLVHLDENNPVNATVVLTVNGQEIDRRTVFVEYPGRGVWLNGQVATGSSDLNVCAEVVAQS